MYHTNIIYCQLQYSLNYISEKDVKFFIISFISKKRNYKYLILYILFILLYILIPIKT